MEFRIENDSAFLQCSGVSLSFNTTFTMYYSNLILLGL